MGNDIISARLVNLRRRLAEKGIEAAIITKRENYSYLSGFTGTSAVLIITRADAVLITDFRYAGQAEAQAPLYRVYEYKGSLIIALNDVIKELGISSLGFEETHIPYLTFTEYSDKLTVNGLMPLEGMLEHMRSIKDENETCIIRQAVNIADRAFEHILGYIKPGVSELEIAAELEYFMKKAGATGPSFETIVASGERAALPHGVASEKVIKDGEAVTLDYGAVYNGYCSDMTRTVFLGQPDEELKKIYGIVLEAQVSALNGAVSGRKASEIDSIARTIIAGKGYEKNFGHGLGHGVGLEIHEEPRLSFTANTTMENGMVVTIEPGIYIAGLGGVRIEDMIVIRDNNPLVLTASTKDMIIL